ncbi:MAG: hypothetical protein DIZ80_03560 [endosymbiont of Galathealinum brachiosum]|uniref:Glutaredoxin domain-containing protein n=1 Tax=endosymbiont of Galathealinum brachiosum TaxID=2200906 RepID=A0A370DJT4_9GAMM|nr:MAG: hypothetical protein DIZ80_03560 [endosymbiont of Galathealinum brachiosum]
MTSKKNRTAFYKQPAIIIFTLFIAGFFLVQHFSRQMISDEPLVLTKANPPEIIMYSTQNCPYCYIAKEFFNKHNLPYTEYDIERSEKHMKMFYLLGGRGTPLVIINKEIIHGYDERLMRKAL